MNNDVIRVSQVQKDDIEKLIPAMLKDCEGFYFATDTVKKINERNYSTIFRMLICKAAEAYNIDIYN